jgi:hypothetical protein
MNKRFDAVYGSITNYQVPVVTLKDLTVEEVCPIFERINSSGTRLSTFDLMVAATWSTSFDLNDEASSIKTALDSKGFGDINGDTILKCLTAVNKKSTKRNDVVNLRKLTKIEMRSLVEKTKHALLKTIDLLSTEFKIYSWDFLPYEALAVIICYIYSTVPALTAEQTIKVRQWFWRFASNERYRGASDTFLSQDLVAIHIFVLDGVGQPSDFGEKPAKSVWETVIFRSNNSRSRAFILALALRGPKNITDGTTIDAANALSSYNQKQFHHIYPRNYLKKIEAPGNHNSLANFCMLAASENREISDTDPNVYLPACIAQLGQGAESTFRSNFLPDPTEFDYETATYPDFVAARTAIIDEAASCLCEGKSL